MNIDNLNPNRFIAIKSPEGADKYIKGDKDKKILKRSGNNRNDDFFSELIPGDKDNKIQTDSFSHSSVGSSKSSMSSLSTPFVEERPQQSIIQLQKPQRDLRGLFTSISLVALTLISTLLLYIFIVCISTDIMVNNTLGQMVSLSLTWLFGFMLFLCNLLIIFSVWFYLIKWQVPVVTVMSFSYLAFIYTLIWVFLALGGSWMKMSEHAFFKKYPNAIHPPESPNHDYFRTNAVKNLTSVTNNSTNMDTPATCFELAWLECCGWNYSCSEYNNSGFNNSNSNDGHFVNSLMEPCPYNQTKCLPLLEKRLNEFLYKVLILSFTILLCGIFSFITIIFP